MTNAAALSVPAVSTQSHRRSRLFRKYITFFVVLVSGALLVSGMVQLYFSYQQSKSAVFELQQREASRAASEIESFINDLEQQISWAVHARGVGIMSDEQLRSDYLRLLRQVPAITDVRHIDAAGSETLRVSRVEMNLAGLSGDYNQDLVVSRAKSGKSAISPVYFRNDSEPYVSIAVPENGPDDGITRADVNLKLTWDIVSQIKIGHAGYAYVVDSDGQLIAHPDISLVLKKTNLSGLSQVRQALAQEDRAARPKDATVSRNFKGDQVLAAYQSIDSPSWTVFVEQPLDEVYAPVLSLVVRTALFLLAGLALSALAGIALARRMVTPIRALQVGASEIGAGRLDHRIQISTDDELEALAEEFNKMSANLRETYARVEERSRDLANALQDLEAKSYELERASQAKSDFLASMSHELRTPLNGIIGFSEVLLNPGLPVDDKTRIGFLQNILNSGRHLLALINDILDLSKVEAGKMELHPMDFSLRDALEGVHAIMAPAAQQRGQTLELVLDPDLDYVRHDAGRFKQIFLNLVSNAVKFTPEGGTITTTTRRVAEDTCEIAVKDTGIGIKLEDQERIFDAFQQVDSGYARQQQGTGLGLALVRQFLDMMGGTITVQSELGHGTTFAVRLPLHQGEIARDEPAQGQGPLVLMVEDDPQAAALLSLQLTRGGFRIEQATSKTQAIDKALKLKPSAITLDIRLPDEGDGWKVLAQLKAQPETKEIPVVVVSVVDDPEAAAEAGAVAALVKPVDSEKLVRTLNQFVNENGHAH